MVYALLALTFLAIGGAIYFQRKADSYRRLDRLADAEDYIRSQPPLYRHYHIDEVQSDVQLHGGVKLTAEETIAIVQAIRDELNMGPIKVYNLPGFQEQAGLQLIDEEGNEA